MNNSIPFNAGLAYSEFRSRQSAFILAGFIAWLASSTFVIQFFAGSLHIADWTMEQWFNGLLALGLVAVVTAFQAFLYSQGEDEKAGRATIIATAVAISFGLFTEISQSMERNEARTQIKAESSQTYQNLQTRIKVETSAPAANPYAGAIAQAQAAKSKHEYELSICDRYAATHGAKRVEKCKTFEQGKIAEYQGQIAAYNQQATGAANAQVSTIRGLAQDARAMETDENNMQPIIKLFASWFGLAMISASFVASAFVIAVFEYAFHYLGKKYAAAKAKLMRNGYDVTRKLRQPPRRADGSLDTYSDKATSAPLAAFAGAADSARQTVADYAGRAEQAMRNAPEAIATDMMQAQAARNALHQNMQAGADRIADTLGKSTGKTLEQIEQEESVAMSHKPLEPFQSKAFPDPAQPPMVDGFDMSRIGKQFAPTDAELQPEQLPTQAPDISAPAPRMSVAATIKALVNDVQASGATSPEAIQAATTAAYSRLFNPADFDAGDLQKIASKIARDLKPATPSPSLPTDQAHGKTGLHNPALGTNEEHFPLPIGEPEKPRVEPRVEQAEKPRVEPRARGLLEADENHVHAVSDEPAKARAAEGAEGTDSLYPEWIAAVRAKECKPTVNNTRLWIQRRIAPTMTGSKTNDLKRIDSMRKGFFARALREGLMQLNDNYTNGGKKYIWIG